MKIQLGVVLLLLLSINSYAGTEYSNLKYTQVNQVSIFSDFKDVKDGDIIFQISTSPQSKAIQLATHAIYSHCGIIYILKGKPYVYEAVGPVKLTALDKWIARGKNAHYLIKRLKNASVILTPSVIKKMILVGNEFLGKQYDTVFNWSDNQIYCSELVWKIYKKATGIEVGKLQKLKDFDLSDHTVQQKLAERYHKNLPLNELVISPSSILQSDLLMTITEN
jgi:Permuted papain-like amidase enzyme, YaeF/YiiX, C92 family